MKYSRVVLFVVLCRGSAYLLERVAAPEDSEVRRRLLKDVDQRRWEVGIGVYVYVGICCDGAGC